MAESWMESFVATSAVLGEPLGDTLEALGGGEDVRASTLVQTLRGGSREAKARAIASALSAVMAALPQWEVE